MHERTHGKRGWAVPAAAGAVAVLWWWLAAERAPCCEAPPAAPMAAAAPPVAASQAFVRPLVITAAPRAAPRRRPMGLVEVCGYGDVQLPPDDPDPVQRIPAAVRQSALDAMDARMLASDDEQVRAAALWMGARLRGREVRSRIEQVARLAAASQDPFVYALGLDACRGREGVDAGSCNLLSVAQWVRLDPDNAVPWQALAAQARAMEETQLEDLALLFAARATRRDVQAGRLPQLVDKALGPQAPPLQRALALSAGWSAEAVWSASRGVAVMHTAQGFDMSCEGVQRRLALNGAER